MFLLVYKFENCLLGSSYHPTSAQEAPKSYSNFGEKRSTLRPQGALIHNVDQQGELLRFSHKYQKHFRVTASQTKITYQLTSE